MLQLAQGSVRRRDPCAPCSCSLTTVLEGLSIIMHQAELHINYFNMNSVPDFTSKAIHVAQEYSVSSSESCFSYLGTDGAWDGKCWVRVRGSVCLYLSPSLDAHLPKGKGIPLCVHGCTSVNSDAHHWGKKKKKVRFLLISNTFWKFLIQWMTKRDFAGKDFYMQRKGRYR